MLPFPQDNNKRKFSCFVCAVQFNTYNEMKKHVVDVHEEGREYLVCPVKYCGAPVRDLRAHFKTRHPACKCPEDRQLRAIIMYDIRTPSKRKKIPNFENGFHVSTKDGKSKRYRSGYEREVYECLDKLGDVIRWEVEPFSVDYYLKGRKKKYFPDLLVEYNDGAIEIWEIKPATQKPLEQNQAKWTSCRHHCQLRGWSFQVVTEDDIMNLKKKSGYKGKEK